ncbi:hypothetical protein F4780DRAFT_776399 [Xylariomycetidae sp. FL0641]|nr:hypothetical protein F4780DRAFT_776399 [Xylariomycetidae sp. FL0641]
MDDQGNTPAHITHLSTEVKQVIFAQLDSEDVPSLALTCNSMLKAYRGAKGIIHHAIALNTVGPALLPIAVAAFAASKEWKTHDTGSSVREFVLKFDRFAMKYLDWKAKEIPVAVTDFSYAMTAGISRLHSAITYLAIQISAVGPYLRAPICGRVTILDLLAGHACFPTQSEMTTVKKGIYVMEILRLVTVHVFKLRRGPRHDPRSYVWNYFPPWISFMVRRLNCRIEELCEPALAPFFNNSSAIRDRAMLLYRLSKFCLFGAVGLKQFLSSTQPNAVKLFLKRCDEEVAFTGSNQFSRPVPALTIPPSGPFWFLPVHGKDGVQRSVSVDHLLEQYPEDDTGLRDLWFFFAMSNKCRGNILSPHELYLDVAVLGIDIAPPVSLDRSRLDLLLPGIIPTMESMAATVKNLTFSMTREDEAWNTKVCFGIRRTEKSRTWWPRVDPADEW